MVKVTVAVGVELHVDMTAQFSSCNVCCCGCCLSLSWQCMCGLPAANVKTAAVLLFQWCPVQQMLPTFRLAVPLQLSPTS